MDGRGFQYSYNPYSYYPQIPYFQGEYSQQNSTVLPNQFSEPSTSTGQSSETSESIISAPSSSSTRQISSEETPKSTGTKKKNYERWTKDEEKMLVRLWADKHDELESKDARKVWDSIATSINKKFSLERTTDKYKKKISYLVDRYKIAKDWNKNQSGGHKRESPYFKEIDEVLGCRDVVTLNHVSDLEAGAASATTSSSHTSDTDDSDGADLFKTKESRTERKKGTKRQKVEAKDDEEREMLKSSLEGLNEQRKNMTAFMDNFTRMQEQQSQTMNALVGALTGFLKNNSK